MKGLVKETARDLQDDDMIGYRKEYKSATINMRSRCGYTELCAYTHLGNSMQPPQAKISNATLETSTGAEIKGSRVNDSVFGIKGRTRTVMIAQALNSQTEVN